MNCFFLLVVALPAILAQENDTALASDAQGAPAEGYSVSNYCGGDVCMCVCVRACVRACMSVCVCECGIFLILLQAMTLLMKEGKDGFGIGQKS